MSILRRIIDWLPRDMSLPDDEFRSRHRALTGMLLLHVPVLFAFGYFGPGFDVVPLSVELIFPLVTAVLGALPMIRRRLRTFAVTTGLIYSSVVLLHMSGGAAESALHFLIVLAFVFLYRDWFLFAWAIVLMGFSYKLLELTQGALGDLVPATGSPEMALWALMTAASIASIGLILAWKSAADSQAATIAALETARERDEAAARRDAYGKMYVNLARRSQSLVDRQLTVIDHLEQQVDDPDILAGVFELDHLTTRIRRHGESLLVVADVNLTNRSTEPVQLSDIVRGAQSEIEQYRRVDARIDPSIVVQPAVTRDLVHLLAELLDNATTYSPPSTTVKVHARAGDSGSVVVTVEDHGLGLTPDRLAQSNIDVQDTNALDENSVRHLGFRVIARLAEKHGITVRLTSTNGGGVTAWIDVPAPAIASADTSNLNPARLPQLQDEPTAASAPSPTQAPATPEPAAPAPVAPTPQPAAPQPAAVPTAQADPAPSAEEPDDAGDLPRRTASPAPMSAGFSASGVRRRGRRARTPVAKPHDRQPAAPGSATSDQQAREQRSSDDETAPPVRPPTVDRPLPTGAVRMPKPPSAPLSATQPDASQPNAPHSGARQPGGGQAGAQAAPAARAAEADERARQPQAGGQDRSAPIQASTNGMPPLPRRERGATDETPAKDEALDLFSDLVGEDTGARSSLGDFQRGQESARKEARE